eukprot:9884336-Alexandrium_andersonii.AAC.1
MVFCVRAALRLPVRSVIDLPLEGLLVVGRACPADWPTPAGAALAVSSRPALVVEKGSLGVVAHGAEQ